MKSSSKSPKDTCLNADIIKSKLNTYANSEINKHKYNK